MTWSYTTPELDSNGNATAQTRLIKLPSEQFMNGGWKHILPHTNTKQWQMLTPPLSTADVRKLRLAARSKTEPDPAVLERFAKVISAQLAWALDHPQFVSASHISYPVNLGGDSGTESIFAQEPTEKRTGMTLIGPTGLVLQITGDQLKTAYFHNTSNEATSDLGRFEHSCKVVKRKASRGGYYDKKYSRYWKSDGPTDWHDSKNWRSLSNEKRGGI